MIWEELEEDNGEEYDHFIVDTCEILKNKKIIIIVKIYGIKIKMNILKHSSPTY